MKYIRTKDEVFALSTKHEHLAQEYGAIKVADTIEELCDEFVVITKENEHYVNELQVLHYTCRRNKNYTLYGAIWTDKGLIYVAKLNERGEWKLL